MLRKSIKKRDNNRQEKEKLECHTSLDTLLSTFSLCQTQFKCKAEVIIHLTSILILDFGRSAESHTAKDGRTVLGRESLADRDDPEATAELEEGEGIFDTLSAVSSFLFEGESDNFFVRRVDQADLEGTDDLDFGLGPGSTVVITTCVSSTL
jgi:hypothetical protein